MQRATVLARDVLGKAGTKDGGNQIKVYLLRVAGKQNLQALSKDDWENGLAALEAKVAEGADAVLKIIKG
jgi:hypothetical protein